MTIAAPPADRDRARGPGGPALPRGATRAPWRARSRAWPATARCAHGWARARARAWSSATPGQRHCEQLEARAARPRRVKVVLASEVYPPRAGGAGWSTRALALALRDGGARGLGGHHQPGPGATSTGSRCERLARARPQAPGACRAPSPPRLPGARGRRRARAALAVRARRLAGASARSGWRSPCATTGRSASGPRASAAARSAPPAASLPDDALRAGPRAGAGPALLGRDPLHAGRPAPEARARCGGPGPRSPSARPSPRELRAAGIPRVRGHPEHRRRERGRAAGGATPPSFPLPERFLLFVGKLEENKGARLLVPAVAAARHGLPLVVLGEGTLAHALKMDAAAAGVPLMLRGWARARGRAARAGARDRARLPVALARAALARAARGAGAGHAGGGHGHRRHARDPGHGRAACWSRDAAALAEAVRRLVADAGAARAAARRRARARARLRARARSCRATRPCIGGSREGGAAQPRAPIRCTRRAAWSARSSSSRGTCRREGVETVLFTRPATRSRRLPGEVVSVPYGAARRRARPRARPHAALPALRAAAGRAVAERVRAGARRRRRRAGPDRARLRPRRRARPRAARAARDEPAGHGGAQDARPEAAGARAPARALARGGAARRPRGRHRRGDARRGAAHCWASAAEKVAVLPNGIDPDEIARLTPARTRARSSQAALPRLDRRRAAAAVGRPARALQGLRRYAGGARTAACARTRCPRAGRGSSSARVPRPARRSASSVARAGLDGPHATCWARVDEPLLHALYERADVFVHATHYEGSSLVTLEAMAHGLPVVATRAGGIPDKVVRRARRAAWSSRATSPALADASRSALGAPRCARAAGRSADASGRGRLFAWPASRRTHDRALRRAAARSAARDGTPAALAARSRLLASLDARCSLIVTGGGSLLQPGAWRRRRASLGCACSRVAGWPSPACVRGAALRVRASPAAGLLLLPTLAPVPLRRRPHQRRRRHVLRLRPLAGEGRGPRLHQRVRALRAARARRPARAHARRACAARSSRSGRA